MIREYKMYKITYLLMAMSIIVYIYTSLKYGLSMSAMQGIQTGGFNPLYVYYYQEYYRLITANFIHFGLMHIFCNVYSLYNLGTLMERILKEKKYAIVIVVSMISTTLFSYILFLFFNIGTSSVMGGISGIIFGLIGSLLALSIMYGDIYSYLFKQIATSVLLMLFISVAVPSISLTGHLGGLIGGFIATVILEKVTTKKEKIIN
nr:rhomboid family intramembrane serine protease [uncultured Faecalibacillus sp.]